MFKVKCTYSCCGTREDIWYVNNFFFNFINIGQIRDFSNKNGIPQYGRATPLPAFRPIFIFFCKCRNEMGLDGTNFFIHFHPY